MRIPTGEDIGDSSPIERKRQTVAVTILKDVLSDVLSTEACMLPFRKENPACFSLNDRAMVGLQTVIL